MSATYRSVVGPPVNNHSEAMAKAKATELERAWKIQQDYKKAAKDRLTRRLAECEMSHMSDDEHPEIDVSEIKGVAGRSGIHGLPGGGFASVTYTGGM